MLAALDEIQVLWPSPTGAARSCDRPLANPLAKVGAFVVDYPPPTATAMDTAAAGQRTDHALMVAARDGELHALGELFERHHRPLFGFLVKLTGNRTAAEDITQTVFHRMLKYRHTYRDDGSFTAWMYHLARRCAADHFRHDQHAPQPTDPAELYARADDAPHAADRAARHDDHELLHAALARLDRNAREVLLLARFQELSFAEIATILECSVGAAKVRAHRALQELRDMFVQLQKRTTLPLIRRPGEPGPHHSLAP